MKKLLSLLMVILITFGVFAQPPQKMSYQCVVRNNNGALMTNQSVRIRITVLQGSLPGTAVYVETQSPTTNVNGLVSIEIGGGTGFDVIDWANGPYFFKTETDPTGGTNYTISGTSQLLSVPYALVSSMAQTADYNNLTNRPNLSGYLTTESDPVFAASPAHGITNGNITNWNTAYGWGNHAGLYRSISWLPAWSDVTGKPVLAAVATSGNYNDLTNKPTLFDGAWSSLTGKPTTIAGYGITDAITTAHPAYGISSTNITNWNTAYGWSNHAGLYRSISWVPAWSDVTGKPVFAAVATSGSYNDLTNKPTISVSTDATLTGNGTIASPLKIAQQAATSGQALKWNGTTWAPGNDLTGTNLWVQNGTNIYYNAGAVGIGTNTPYGFLDIYGNSNSGFAHLCLTENEADFARLMFKNTITSTKSWSIAGGTNATDANSILNFYYNNGSTGNNFLSIAGNGNINISGNVGIGTTTPAAPIHVLGTSTGGGNVVFVGEQKNSNPGSPPVTGYGTRMMWYPDKAAFRAGYIEGAHWDAPNIGNFSTATGRNTVASGSDAIAMGAYGNASGSCSAALGFLTIASTCYSTALGFANVGGGNATEWVSTDPLFEIGNGGGTPLQRHNAMTVLKNGYVGFGTALPASGLHITADTWPGSFIFLEANSGSDAGVRFYEGANPKWHIYNNAAAGGLQITNNAAMTAIFANQINSFVGIGTSNPTFTLDVAGAVNLTKGLTGAALFCNGSQAIWYDGTCYSWGYQGTYNYFANKVTIGNAANPSYMLYVQGNAYSTGTWSSSDIRFKKNVSPIDNALSGIMKIRGVSFEFRNDEFKDYQFDEGTQFGFIAQELEDVFPEIVKTESDGFKSVNYNGIIPLLLESVKEQQKQIADQQKQIDDLKTLVKRLINNQQVTRNK